MNDASDANAIARVLSGDRHAFERLISRWDGEVLNLAYRLTGNLEDARDIRQTAFVRAYVGLGDFDGRARFSSWLFRIVVNLCRDHGRRVRSTTRLRRAAESQHIAPEPGDHPVAPAERSELGALVADAVLALPPAQREVLVLRHYHQLPLRDVASVVGIPVTTARSRLVKGLVRVRETLESAVPGACEDGGTSR